MKTKNATAKIHRQRRATQVNLSSHTARRFDAIAEKHGLNRRDVINDAINEWLDLRQVRDLPRDFIHAINDAINEWLDRYFVILEINQLDGANETDKHNAPEVKRNAGVSR